MNEFVEELARGPNEYAKSFRALWYKGTHYRTLEADKSAEATFDSGIGGTYWGDFVSGPKDKSPIVDQLDYFGYIEKILEIDYDREEYNRIVFVAKWYATNKKPIRLATQVMDECGFVRHRKDRWMPRDGPQANTITPPADCEQVYFVDDPSSKEWVIVVPTRARARRLEGELDATIVPEDDLEEIVRNRANLDQVQVMCHTMEASFEDDIGANFGEGTSNTIAPEYVTDDEVDDTDKEVFTMDVSDDEVQLDLRADD